LRGASKIDNVNARRAGISSGVVEPLLLSIEPPYISYVHDNIASAYELALNMKLFLAYIVIASTATIAAATSCTSDNALPWPYTPGETGTDCNGDATCEALAAEGQCNSLSLIDDSDTT
jgi:hypothetical protein